MGMLLRRHRDAYKNLTKLDDVAPVAKEADEKKVVSEKKKSTKKK